MLTFLRKIRKSLIKSGSTTRYLFYAIGEIGLVVIGILIALQINNWNENNKRKQQEKKILIEILNDLNHDHGEISNDLNSHRKKIKNGEELIWKIINKKGPDTLGFMVYLSSLDNQFYSKSSGFENLKSVGLDIITNDSIRMEITNLYQLYFKRLIDMGSRENTINNISEIMNPYVTRYTGVDRNVKWTIPYDEETDTLIIPGLTTINSNYLINDEGLILDLHTTIRSRESKVNFHNRVLRKVEELQSLIQDELDNWE